MEREPSGHQGESKCRRSEGEGRGRMGDLTPLMIRGTTVGGMLTLEGEEPGGREEGVGE